MVAVLARALLPLLVGQIADSAMYYAHLFSAIGKGRACNLQACLEEHNYHGLFIRLHALI